MRMLPVVLIASAFSFQTNVHAVSLAGRATDETVCDLSPMTNYRLTRKVFVPARTSRVSEIYARLALQYVTVECRNGQVLILHSEYGRADDDSAFRQVSQELCSISEIQREPTPTADYPHSFQIKCRIQKMQDAKQRLAAAVSKQSTEEMIRTRSPWINTEPQGPNEVEQSRKKECPQTLTVGQVLFGLGGHCGRD